MNKIKYFILLIIGLSLYVSCSEHNMITYTGGDGIYFEGTNNTDSLVVSWASYPNSVQTMDYPVRVRVFGKPASYDRPFSIKITDEPVVAEQAVKGVDYENLEVDYIIPANEVYLDVVVKLKRNSELLDGGRRVLSFHLLENEHFKYLYDRYYEAKRPIAEGDTVVYDRHVDTHRSIIQNELVYKQHWWPSGEPGHNNFGVWSVKKSLFICDYLGLDRDLWLSGNRVDNITDTHFSFYGKKIHRYLLENPQYEDDGTLMTMGPLSII